MGVALRNALLVVLGVLVLALVAPSFIDWNRYKPLIEARIEEFLGRDVTIGGDLDFALLPQPKLLVGDLAIGNAKGATAPELLRVKMMEARVALFPLFVGRIRVDGIRLIEPVVNLERLADGTLNWDGIPKVGRAKHTVARADFAPRLGWWLIGPDSVSIRSVRVERGTFTYIDHRLGWQETLTPIDGRFAADTLAGPFRARAIAGFRGVPLTLTLNLGKGGREGRRAVETSLADPARAIKATLIGRLEDAVLSGAFVVHADDPPALWKAKPAAKVRGTKAVTLEGALTASREAFFLRDIDIRWGAFRATGAADAHFDQAPVLTLALSGGALDLDAVLPPAPVKAEGITLPWPFAVLGLDLEASDRKAQSAATQPATRGLFSLWRGNFSLRLNKLVVKGDTVAQLKTDAVLVPGGIEHLTVGADLPGESTLALEGRVAPGPQGPAFEGTVDLEGARARGFLSWLGVPVESVSKKRLLNFAYRGGLHVGTHALAFTDFTSKLDNGEAEGTVSLSMADRIRFEAALYASRLNLDTYRAIWTAMTAQGGEPRPLFDRLFALLARSDGTLALTADSFAYRGAELKAVKANATVKEGALALERFDAGNVGGGHLSLRGEIRDLGAAPQVALDARLKARDGASALRALGLPLRPRSGSATPLSVTLAANGPRVAVRLSPISFVLGNQSLEGEGSFNFADLQPRLDVSFHAGRLDLSPLLDGKEDASAPAIWSDEPIALEGLGDFDGALSFEAQSLKLLGIALDKPRFSAKLENGLLDFRDVRGGIFGGNFTANASLRGGTAMPGFGLSFKFTGLDAAPMSEILWDWPVLAGRLEGGLSLAAQGESEIALARALSGTFAVKATNGTLSGFNLSAFRLRTKAAGIAKALPLLERGTTPFSALSFGSDIGSGKLTITEGKIALKEGVARLEGGADIAARTLSTQLRLPAMEAPEAPPVVIRFDGPIVSPAVSRDVKALSIYLDRRTASAAPPPAAAAR